MSGFVAATRNHDDPDLQRHLGQMSQEIAHRGNREVTEVFSARCATVARFRDHSGYRVHTYSNERFAIVVDGLIFNKSELGQAIGSEPSTDIAQIVLDGFEQRGESWFSQLDGSFAVMIADLRSGEVILARDRFAHRPLYFGIASGSVWVANEIKAILSAPGFQSSINEGNLYSAISYGMTPGPQTLFKNVYKCVPGFVFRISDQGVYRSIDYLKPTIELRQSLSLADAKDFLMSALRKSVERYVSECPNLGVLLSGGVDSALLAHLAIESGGKNTVAISFGAEGWASDESEYAGEFAERLGLDFLRTFVRPEDDLLGSLRQVISVLEEPTRFENAVALEMTGRDAAERCTALMTGEGADFILGEREHVVANRLTSILRIPGILRAIAGSLPLEKLPSAHLRALAPYLRWQSIRDYGQRCSANCCDLVPGGGDSPPRNEIVDMLADVTSDWPVGAQYTFMTLREAAHCWIERMEKVTAAAGLECFHPFESNEIFQFGLELPDHIRNSNGINKPAVRSLAADRFGDTVAYREKKQLAAPMQLWLNQSDQLRSAVMNLKKPDSRIRAYLDNAAVDKYLDLYQREGAQREATAVPLFRMLGFELWLERFT
jgi:asparagine synthase (glutamine-hydrolysing)